MAKVVVRVDGLRELGQAMRGLSNDINRRVSRAATNAAAQVVRKQAVKNAPERTGNLKKNIIVKSIPRSQTDLTSEHIVTIRQKRTKKQKQAGIESAFYGMFLEFGTVKMAARPFLRPAFESEKDAAREAMVKRLRDRIQKANKEKAANAPKP